MGAGHSMLNLDKALQIKGWMTGPELEWLARTAKKSRIIIEFGCYLGRSTRAIADNTNALIFAVDPWTSEYYDKDGNRIDILVPDSYEQFRANLKDYLESGQVEAIRCKSDEFPNIGEGFADFIFIDGDHRYESVKRDIELAEKLAGKAGIISGHDYIHEDWPGVKKAVDEKYGEGNVNLVNSIWWTLKK